jgi:sugar-specific transcriptional regulator TrmB
MSLEKALKTLMSLGLTLMDAQVYVYLAKKGPCKGNNLAQALKLPRKQLGLCLENLLNKGMVSTITEGSGKYFAIPLEEVLDEFMKASKEQATALQENKKELVSSWRALTKEESEGN